MPGQTDPSGVGLLSQGLRGLRGLMGAHTPKADLAAQGQQARDPSELTSPSSALAGARPITQPVSSSAVALYLLDDCTWSSISSKGWPSAFCRAVH